MTANDEESTGRGRAEHPRACAMCDGTGWMEGPANILRYAGRDHITPTLTPCTHRWWDDDLGYDPRRDDRLGLSDPRAQAAFNIGYCEARGG